MTGRAKSSAGNESAARATERDERGTEPVGLARGVAQHPTGGGEAGQDGVTGRLVDAEAAGELGEAQRLVGLRGEHRDGRDHAFRRRGDPGHASRVSQECSNIATLVLHISIVRRWRDHARRFPGGPMHELVIRGGTLVDGTGAPPRPADVAVDDGVITEVAAPGALDDAVVAPHRRRRRPARHARLRRPAHALRRPGHLGPAAHAVVLARRHHAS